MSSAVILGAGPLGSAIAHALTRYQQFTEIMLVDESVAAASGKALDIRQSGPIDHFDAHVAATDDVLAAASASVVVVADAIAGGEWRDDNALAMLQPIVRAGTRAPFVLAGPTQMPLLEAMARTLNVPADRLVGTAAAAMVGAARALVGLEVGGSGVDVHANLVGRPKALVAAWSSATAGGSLVTDRVPAHRLLAVSSTLARLWPPGLYAIAAATARVASGLVFGSRQAEQAVTLLDGEFDARGIAAMLPLELGHGRVLRRLEPSLSPQERTEITNRCQR